jgi:hypothetical protein
VIELAIMTERPWGEWGCGRKPITPRQVATLLKLFGIFSKTIRLHGGDTSKGYERAQFDDVFFRYLGSQSVTTSQTSNDADFRTILSVKEEECVTDKKSRKPASDNGCDVVTDTTGGRRGKKKISL